jgi:hypothetical protein
MMYLNVQYLSWFLKVILAQIFWDTGAKHMACRAAASWVVVVSGSGKGWSHSLTHTWILQALPGDAHNLFDLEPAPERPQAVFKFFAYRSVCKSNKTDTHAPILFLPATIGWSIDRVNSRLIDLASFMYLEETERGRCWGVATLVLSHDFLPIPRVIRMTSYKGGNSLKRRTLWL